MTGSPYHGLKGQAVENVMTVLVCSCVKLKERCNAIPRDSNKRNMPQDIQHGIERL